MNWRDACRVTGFLEPGETDHWRVSRFTLEEKDAAIAKIRAIMDRRGYTPPGEYTRLDRLNGEHRTIVMSDTRDEINDLSSLFWSAPQGRILINGLGLGCVLKGVLSLDGVAHVDVVEIDPEVIQLVGSQFDDQRLTIHQGDAFTFQWPAGLTWDFVWHDVWDALSSDNLSDEEYARPGTYARLNRRYGRRAGWQGAWGQDYLKSQRSRGW